METFFKPGDVVTVRTDLDVTRNGERFPYYMDDKKTACYFTPGMSELAGKNVTIGSIDMKRYRILEFGLYWTDEMFEEYADPSGSKYEPPSSTDILGLLKGVV